MRRLSRTIPVLISFVAIWSPSWSVGYRKAPEVLETDAASHGIVMVDAKVRLPLAGLSLDGGILLSKDGVPVESGRMRGSGSSGLLLFHDLEPGSYQVVHLAASNGQVAVQVPVPPSEQLEVTVSAGSAHYLGRIKVRIKTGRKPPGVLVEYEPEREIEAWSVFVRNYEGTVWSEKASTLIKEIQGGSLESTSVDLENPLYGIPKRAKAGKNYKSKRDSFSVIGPESNNWAGVPFTVRKYAKDEQARDEVIFHVRDFGELLVAGTRVAYDSTSDILRETAQVLLREWHPDHAARATVQEEISINSRHGTALLRLYFIKEGAETVQTTEGIRERMDARLAVMVARNGDVIVYAVARYDMDNSNTEALKRRALEFFETIALER